MKEIFSIHAYLEKYRTRLRPPEASVIENAIQIALDLCGIALTRNDLEYNSHQKALFIKASGAKKSELLLRRDSILSRLRESLGDRDAPTQLF